MPDTHQPRPVSLHELARLDAEGRQALLSRVEDDLAPFIAGATPIIDRVKSEGDAALAEFGRQFDKAELTEDRIAATPDDFGRAQRTLDPAVKESIAFAAEGIRRFHQRQMPESMWIEEIRPGAFAGERWRPIPSVACYVPRGKGAFPSVALMTTVPAVVAAVPRVVIVTPPGPDGEVDDATLVAAEAAGVTEVYKCGGAQAVAAVAYGTATVPRVDKIVGPGSPWMIAAKRILADRIDPGIPAGPSEAIVLADGSADGRLAALDLIIESEHGDDSSAYLVTDSRAVAEAAMAAIPEFWGQMGAERIEYSSAVLGGARGGVVLAPDMDAAIAFVNDYAPEHLHLHTADPWETLGSIEHAGEVLMGRHAPLVLGNFVLGPNAVLPTGGSARTWSALSVFDFLKRISIGYVTEQGYRTLAPHARRLALYEGFDGHANAISKTRDRLLDRKPE